MLACSHGSAEAGRAGALRGRPLLLHRLAALVLRRCRSEIKHVVAPAREAERLLGARLAAGERQGRGTGPQGSTGPVGWGGTPGRGDISEQGEVLALWSSLPQRWAAQGRR